MTQSQPEQSPERQVQAARKAFDQDIERFVRFCEPSQLSQIDLETAIAEERAFAEIRARHLGKKSALAASKKLIGRVAPEMRPAFGQLVQSHEDAMVQTAEKIESGLKSHIESQRTARESIEDRKS